MSKPCQEHDWIAPQQTNARATPQELDQARNQQLDQLKANAKAHKKHVDRLSAKISQLTVKLDQSEKWRSFYQGNFEAMCIAGKIKVGNKDGYMIPGAEPKKSDRTKWSTLLIGAGFVYLSGFLLTLGFFSAVGWVGFIGEWAR
ncbi:hypothetical protein D3C80_1149970 [compost metagenome]